MSEPSGGYAVELWLTEDPTAMQLQDEAERLLHAALAPERARGRAAPTVEIRDRVARLAGTVACWGEKLAARAAVMRAQGLVAVDDAAVTVVPPLSETWSDAQLAGMARSVIDWSWRVPRGAVHVTAANGQLTLSGTLAHDDERRAAIDAVAGLAGVREVVNEILVPPRPRPLHARALIEEELERVLGRDGRHARVTLNDIGVRVTGRAATPALREATEHAVRRILGDVPLSLQFR